MYLASPVRRAMLDASGPGKANDGGHFNFLEDDPDTLRSVLDIVHFHFHRIPISLIPTALDLAFGQFGKYDQISSR